MSAPSREGGISCGDTATLFGVSTKVESVIISHLQITEGEVVVGALAGMKCPGRSSRYTAPWPSAAWCEYGHLLRWSTCGVCWSSISP